MKSISAPEKAGKCKEEARGYRRGKSYVK